VVWGRALSSPAELANVRAMFCLPAAVSLAMIAAPVPVPVLAQAAPVAATGPAAATSPEAHTPWRCGDNQARYKPADRVAQKYWREQTGRFVAAPADERITILEAAWTETRDPCFLYFLYRANEKQGHYLQAYAQAQQLQAMGAQRTPPDVAEYILQVHEGSRDCGVTLRLDDVAPPTGAEVQATYQGLAAGDDLTGRCALSPCNQTISLTQPQNKQALRVGQWTLVAGPGSEFTPDSAAAGEPVDSRTFVVDHCAAPRTLTLRASNRPIAPPPVVTPVVVPPPVVTPAAPPEPIGPATPKPPTDMRRLSNVGIGVGAGLVLAGGVLVVVGATQWSGVYHAGLDDECNSAASNGTARCRAALGGPTALRTTGAGVFGGGAGLLLPAMVLRRSSKAQRETWLPIVGGLTTVMGAALVGVATTAFNRSYGPESTVPWAERSAGSMHLHTVGGALTGFGVGLLGSALARCVWRGACGSRGKPGGRASLQVAPGRLPGGAAIAVSGRF